MQPYFEFSRQVRHGRAPEEQTVRALSAGIHGLTSGQAGAFLAFCERAPAVQGRSDLVSLARMHAATKGLTERPHGGLRPALQGLKLVDHLFSSASWSGLVGKIVDGTAGDPDLGYLLASITLDDLNESDTLALTRAMRDSGKVYDYRASFPHDILLRRYPTGALSEKIALMMPTMISALRHDWRLAILSPFIVARALGHTGGTWDKLLAIKGFSLPRAGDESVAVLKACGACYSVTLGDFNPADAKLYALRHETDTIQSDALISSSIASKMQACPVHFMQLDVRYGPGSFFDAREHAALIGRRISQFSTVDGMKCFFTLTETHEITGSSIGRAIEVAEGIEALGGGSQSFDVRGIAVQRQIAASFLARLAAEAFGLELGAVYRWLYARFDGNGYADHFARVLTAHGVEDAWARTLWRRPRILLDGLKRSAVRSEVDGRVEKIDQLRLGRAVDEPAASIELKKRMYDAVAVGEPLMETFTAANADLDETALRDCFGIR